MELCMVSEVFSCVYCKDFLYWNGILEDTFSDDTWSCLFRLRRNSVEGDTIFTFVVAAQVSEEVPCFTPVIGTVTLLFNTWFYFCYAVWRLLFIRYHEKNFKDVVRPTEMMHIFYRSFGFVFIFHFPIQVSF